MQIGFFNYHPMRYDVDTPLVEPLGGSESAMCYLAVEMAKLGHEVTLFRRFEEEFTKKGVFHMPLHKIGQRKLDVLVVQNTPFPGAQMRLKKLVDDKVKIIFWSQHASNQPPVETLYDAAIVNAFNKIVLISNWQRQDYLETFKIKKSKIRVLKNAISPAFENLNGRKRKLSMAYTSTPFRGLSLLTGIFSVVKSEDARASLEVFSSWKVYQVDRDQEEQYAKIYQACRETLGVTYVGSVSQSELAKRLADIEILAYPNIFPETSCIAVMEAMAAGCQIVTSRLGALPETTAGFGRLISVSEDWGEYCRNFKNALLEPVATDSITKQVEFVKANYTWKKRAQEWEQLLVEVVNQ